MWLAMAVEAHDAARSTWHRPHALPFHRKLPSVSSTACSRLRNPNYSKNVHQSLFFLWFQRETAFANFMGHKWTQTHSSTSVVSLHGSWHWPVFVPWRGKIQHQQPCNLLPTLANQLGLTWVMMRFWSLLELFPNLSEISDFVWLLWSNTRGLFLMLHLDDMSSNMARKCISCNARFSHGTPCLTWDSRFCQITIQTRKNHSTSSYMPIFCWRPSKVQLRACHFGHLDSPTQNLLKDVEGLLEVVVQGTPTIDINWLYHIISIFN